MPLDYRIEDGRLLGRTRGDVDDDEVARTMARLAEDLAYCDGCDELWDLSDHGRFDVTPQGVRDLVGLKQRTPAFHGKRCALVAPDDLVYGMMRMLELLSENEPWEVRVFRDREEAESWLARERAS